MASREAENTKQIPSYFQRKIIAYLVDLSHIPYTEVVEAVGLSSSVVLRSDDMISTHLAYRLIKFALERTDNPSLGLKYGLSIHMSDLEMLGYAASAQSTIRDALQLVAQHYSALTHLSQLTIDDERDFFIRISCQSSMPDYMERFLTEAIVAGILENIRRLGIDTKNNAKAYFSYSKPSYSNLYSGLAVPVHFDQQVSGIFLTNHLVDAKLSTVDPTLLSDIGLPQGAASNSNDYKQSLENNILLSLPTIPSIEESAQQLGVSKRTLQRRLKDSGTDYRQLIEKVRIKEAVYLLSSGTLSIAQIAQQIGFADASSFSRAFKRLEKMTPGEYRRQSS